MTFGVCNGRILKPTPPLFQTVYAWTPRSSYEFAPALQLALGELEVEVERLLKEAEETDTAVALAALLARMGAMGVSLRG
jgi:hypothetical protein